MTQDELKQQVAQAAVNYIKSDMIIGIGTGSTTNYFIDALVSVRHLIKGTIASSDVSKKRLEQNHIPFMSLTMLIA